MKEVMDMDYQQALSTGANVETVVEELREQLAGVEPALVLYFASCHLHPAELAEEMQAAFGFVPTVGCTTAGELGSGAMLENSVVALAFGKDAIPEVHVEVATGLRKDTRNSVRWAVGGLEAAVGHELANVPFGDHLGLVLVDGMSSREELLMDALGDLTNVPFVGGSAGDNLAFDTTYVMAEGRAYNDAAVLVLLEPRVRFSILKTQSFVPSGRKLRVTGCDEQTRRVMSFNERPALEAYAEALGVSAVEAVEHFMHHPVGLMIEGEPFVRSPQKADGNDILFYCNVKEGMELEVLESGDILDDTARALDEHQRQHGPIQALINFNCILRTLALQKEGKTDEYGLLFAEVPSVGFSTYGEQYVGHINQTSTIVAFGGPTEQPSLSLPPTRRYGSS